MPTRELYVQGTQEPQPPGIEPPHWTTEDYRSRYWAVHVSYQFPSSATWWGGALHNQGAGGARMLLFSWQLAVPIGFSPLTKIVCSP